MTYKQASPSAIGSTQQKQVEDSLGEVHGRVVQDDGDEVLRKAADGVDLKLCETQSNW